MLTPLHIKALPSRLAKGFRRSSVVEAERRERRLGRDVDGLLDPPSISRLDFMKLS